MSTHRDPISQMEIHKHRSKNAVSPDFPNQLKIQSHFPAHACCEEYLLMIRKLQQIRNWLTYPPSDRVVGDRRGAATIYTVCATVALAQGRLAWFGSCARDIDLQSIAVSFNQ